MSEAGQILESAINDFSVDKFSRFFREKSRRFAPREENYSHYDDDDVKNGLKIGEINFQDDAGLIVCAFEVKKELSERAGRKSQYEKAKKILKDRQIFSAGIFIFYDRSGNFRFSLIYPESIGTRRQWSNFRRFTYFVENDLINKTFKHRIGDGDFSTLAEIKDAFSVEKVTKEFYLEYRKLFENLFSELSKNRTFLNEASKNGLNTENFAKKLLGQIVFVYFIQKKGWLGVPEGGKWGKGDKNFLSNLFKEAKKNNNNFFNDYLEKLFYNVLNNPRRDTVDPSFSKDFNCRIPFLNGGLFEAEYNWQDSRIYLDDKIFQEIFDVFDRYNFTVEEESPDDKEIAVDPEMLGKVFENLLNENLRKGRGAYYTPREIVYYMCRESLINYLSSNLNIEGCEFRIRKFVNGDTMITKEELSVVDSVEKAEVAAEKVLIFIKEEAKSIDVLLANIKICDPACGSGAFLVGMLNEIVRMRKFLDEWYFGDKAKEYQLKKEAIQNCIYGVDIDPGAIEIAKLRLWLQLVVDYELKDIEPLPNLDYRLMCGNSLLEEFEGVKFYNGENSEEQATLLVDTEKQAKISKLKSKVKEYFDIHDDKEKQAKRKEINDIKDWLVRSALEKRKQDLASQRENEESKANMLDKKSREKYLASWSDKFLAEGKIKEVLDDLHNPKATKPFFIWKLEFIDVFEDKKGFDVVIGNPPYEEISSKSEKEIYQKYYPSVLSGHYDLYIFFFKRAFDIANNNGLISFITSHTYIHYPQFINLRKYIFGNGHILEITNRISGIFESAVVDNALILIQKGNIQGNQMTIFSSKKEELNKLINEKVVILKRSEFDFANFDFKAIKNRKILSKFLKDTKPLGDITESSQGITVYAKVQGAKKDWFRDKEIDKNSKPVIRGRDVFLYELRWAGRYIQYGDWLWCHRNKKFFENEKLFFRQTADRLIGTYECKPIYCIDSVHSIINQSNNGLNLKYILAILNSKFGNFLYNLLISEVGKVFAQVKLTFLRQIPIQITSQKDQKPFIEIVDKILAITASGDYLENPAKKEEVKEYEKQIDQMVYKLYDLTEEEIKIVEGAASAGKRANEAK